MRARPARPACRRASQRGQLVDQHAHAHAAPRGGEQFVQHQVAGVVLVEDVGLQVDRAARAADQVDARQQRVRAAVEDQRVVARRARAWTVGERGVAQVAQRRGLRAGIGAVAGRARSSARATATPCARSRWPGDSVAQPPHASASSSAARGQPSRASIARRVDRRRSSRRRTRSVKRTSSRQRHAPAVHAVVAATHAAAARRRRSRAPGCSQRRRAEREHARGGCMPRMRRRARAARRRSCSNCGV